MPVVVSVEEFEKEGIAIIEDTVGKFVVTKHSPDMIPIDTPKPVIPAFPRREVCALLQDRSRMLM